MWLKLCLLLIYIIVLFLLARMVEVLTWYETGSLSRRLLDPMTLSVAKLKALLEQRGVSYDTVVEKVELTQLVEGSGTVHEDEIDLLQSLDENSIGDNTNFTSGAHFYEQVEDAKDSVWLVQILAKPYSHNHVNLTPLSEATWKSIRKKVNKFGIHTGVLDCTLDPWWCERRGWHSSHLMLALPQLYKQKANVATHVYDGPHRESAISRWIRQKLQEKIDIILDFHKFQDEWLTFRKGWQESEIRILLLTDQNVIPMFFSALSVKFSGRVKFGVIIENNGPMHQWTQTLLPIKNISLPIYLIITNEMAYIYGKNQGDCLTFSSMEMLLRFLHPCLNDIFIFSFIVANVVSVLEFITTQGNVVRRLRRFLWCVVKYNAAVIMLWLPLITLFQLPFLDHFPLLGLKSSRLLATSSLGEAIRRDIFFLSQHPCILVVSFLSACAIFGITSYKLTGGRYEDNEEPWFNFAQMRTLTHLRSNEFFEPMFMSGYELSGGMEIFGSRLYLPTTSLQPVVSLHYINLLPTWQYCNTVKYVQHCCENCTLHQLIEDTGEGMNQSLKSDTNLDQDISADSPNHRILNNPYTASVTGLQDGNYHCECQIHANKTNTQTHSLAQDQNFSIQTTSVRNSSSIHFSSDFIECSCGQRVKSSTLNGNTVSEEDIHYHESDITVCSPGFQNLMTESVHFPEGYLMCSQCVICLEEFSPGITLCGLPCGHVFHHSCILTWLKCDHHFCPICRWPSFQPRSHLVHAHAE